MNESETRNRGDQAETQRSSASRGPLSEQSKKIATDVRELGEIAVNTASQTVDELRERGSQALSSGRERALEAKTDFERYVIAQPVKAIAMAVGAGILLSLLARR